MDNYAAYMFLLDMNECCAQFIVMGNSKGIIAAGHELTANAGAMILESGGNAYDAILAAAAASCVCEPILSSLGGGGFLLACPEGMDSIVYDFFVKTSFQRVSSGDLDFKAVNVHFGSESQEFHIGKGAVAVPGQVAGFFEIHKSLCTMPIQDIFAPAIEYAKKGVRINRYQGFLLDVNREIITADEECKKLFTDKDNINTLLQEGQVMSLPEMSDVLDVLTIEGADLFYRGEIASLICADMKDGGLIKRSDMEGYCVEKRDVLALEYKGVNIEMNPPPAIGGLLISFGLKLLKDTNFGFVDSDSEEYIEILAHVLELTQAARIEKEASGKGKLCKEIIAPDFVELYRREIIERIITSKGTTHISVIDSKGNMASMTLSNGEGSSYVIPGTAIQMNNMLGEKDLNPAGFHKWKGAKRLSSMMTPMVMRWPDGRKVVTGSAGANRIRSALLQQIVRLVDFGVSIEDSVTSPRIHVEHSHLSIEGGFKGDMKDVLKQYPDHTLWEELNMFFGGINSVGSGAGLVGSCAGLSGCGDPRRDGVCIKV